MFLKFEIGKLITEFFKRFFFVSLGYCPQFDALFPRLTTRQHLEFYGSVKGVPHELLEEKVTLLKIFIFLYI